MIKYIYFLIFDICLFQASPAVMDKGFMAVCAVMAAVKVVMTFFEGNSKRYNLKKIYFRHSIIFVLCFYIVFFQSDIDFIVGLAEEDDYFVYNPKVVCKAMALSSMALTCFLLGYCFSKNKEACSNNYAKSDSIKYVFPRQRLRGLILLTVLLILIYVIFVPKEYLSNGYGNAVDAGPIGAITGYLIAFFIALFVSYSLRYYNNKNGNWIEMFKLPLILLSVYALLIIVTGRRTEVVRLAFVAMCSYVFISGRNAYIKRILFLSAIGMLVLAVLGIYRSLQEGTVVDGYNQMKNILSVMPPTKELSTSVNTLHVAMTYYPDKKFFDMGASFLPSFLKIIPGLTGLLHFLGLQMKGSDLIISELFFEGGQIEWGLGSSIIADIYISFGVLGVLLVFYVLGRFIRWLEVGTFCKSATPYFLALSFSCYSQFMFACRGGVGVFFLCWTYACIIIYLIVRPVKVINKYVNENK